MYVGGISCDSRAKERGFSGVLDFVPRQTFLYGKKTRAKFAASVGKNGDCEDFVTK